MVTATDACLEFAAKLFNGVSTAPFKYVAFGSGQTAEATTQTALVTEITGSGLARSAGTASYEATGKAVITHTATANASITVWERGLFDAASSGNMATRHKYATAKNLDAGESIQTVEKITFARSA